VAGLGLEYAEAVRRAERALDDGAGLAALDRLRNALSPESAPHAHGTTA
jgi:hypothetical protein